MRDRDDRGPAASDGASQVGGPASTVAQTPDRFVPTRLSDVYADPADAAAYLLRWNNSPAFRAAMVAAAEAERRWWS